MGGMGSGDWYRFNKKIMTGECQRVDVRYLHREGLLKTGRWFSLRWSRAGRNTGSMRAAVIGDEKAEGLILTYRHRSGLVGERSSRRMGRCAGARAPELDAVQVKPLPIHLSTQGES